MTSKHGEVIMFKISNENGPGLCHTMGVEDPLKYGQVSAVGEMDFIADGQVENWLCDLEFKMRETLYDVLRDAKNTSEMWDVTEVQS